MSSALVSRPKVADLRRCVAARHVQLSIRSDITEGKRATQTSTTLTHSHSKMPVRLSFRLSSRATARCARAYSSDTAPLINVVNVPAPGSGHIRILELNRPSARNAISRALLSSLRAEIDDVHAQYTKTGDEVPSEAGGAGPTRALVLASAVDASFCAGADLKERRGFTPEE